MPGRPVHSAPLDAREKALARASARETVDYALAELAQHPEAARQLALHLNRLLTMEDLKVLFGFKTDEPIVKLIRDGVLTAVKVGKEWRCSWANYHAACERLFAQAARPVRTRRKAR